MGFARLAIGITAVAVALTLTAAPSQSAPAPVAGVRAAAQMPGGSPVRARAQFHGTGAVVEAIEQVGDRLVVAGHGISSLTQGNGARVTTDRAGLTATPPGDPSKVTWMGPAGGQWWSLLPDADAQHVYAGSGTGVSKFDLATGRQTWTHGLGGKVTTIESIPGTAYLIVGGYFPGGIAALRKDTGAVAAYSVPQVGEGGFVHHADVQPHGNHWVGVGGFRKVGAATRSQVVMLTLSATAATVTPWDAPVAHGPNGVTPCRSDYTDYLHDVAFLHDGSAFFLVGTGASDRGLCDAVSRFDMGNLNRFASPVWITGTCTDTFWSVGVSPSDAYLLVGGHFKCIGRKHNPTRGTNVSRFSLAALDPSTGNVLPWKADKCRSVGTREISWVDGGVAVGYDCPFFGNHESINADPSPQVARDRFAVLPLP